MVVAAQGITYDWTRNNLQKNGYIPLGSILEDIVRQLRIIKSIENLISLLINLYINHTVKN